MESNTAYSDATMKTGDNLRTIAHSDAIRELSSLSLPQIDNIVDRVARVVPAGNVPGMILNGLTRLPDRKLPLQTVKRDINLLFKGVEQTLRDGAVYSAFFAGPAAVIWGYQNLLRLAGKDPETSFPEGIWQFYLEYALRDDTARHANETHGFDTLLQQHGLRLSTVDRLTAWAMTAVHCLHQYNRLLENEWRERVFTYVLRQVTQNLPNAARYARLYQEWEKQRPYSRGPDVAPHDDYPTYRRQKFDQFLALTLQGLPAARRREWQSRVAAAESELRAYQQQMSIVASLEPSKYEETRVPIPLAKAHVGLIVQGHYYLLPASGPDSEQPAAASTVRSQVASLVTHPPDTEPARLQALARVKRAALAELREALQPTLRQELETLRLAPIWLNFDRPARHLPLAALRQAERAVGDHPLTVFDTGESFVFDQSHIFFDGAWGAALAEILTNEALAWAVYLHTLPPAQPGSVRPYSPALQLSPADWQHLAQAPLV
ncbi:MAG: hypothetical protein L0322_23980, partial [Chloroflexi bacterium]|nr:hypothetical protein [Chloroflexota bacterium]